MGVRSSPIVTSERMTLTRAGLHGSVVLVRSIGSKVLAMSGCSVPGWRGLSPAASSKSHMELQSSELTMVLVNLGSGSLHDWFAGLPSGGIVSPPVKFVRCDIIVLPFCFLV